MVYMCLCSYIVMWGCTCMLNVLECTWFPDKPYDMVGTQYMICIYVSSIKIRFYNKAKSELVYHLEIFLIFIFFLQKLMDILNINFNIFIRIWTFTCTTSVFLSSLKESSFSFSFFLFWDFLDKEIFLASFCTFNCSSWENLHKKIFVKKIKLYETDTFRNKLVFKIF